MNYYQILGIVRNASTNQIQAAFRGKALRFHPERATDLASLVEFARICEAYEILHKAEYKAVYDLYGEEILKNGSVDEHGGRIGGCFKFDPKLDPLRVFKEFFATDNPYESSHQDPAGLHATAEKLASYKPPAEGPITRLEVICELEDVYYGRELTVPFTRSNTSPNGKVQLEQKELKIQLTPGEEEGTIFRFEGEGDRSGSFLPGTVECTLRILPHAKFRREGLHLHCEIDIPVHQAFCSAPVQVETIEQKKLSFLLPCVVTPGLKHVIKGEGMKTAQAQGDLIVEMKILFPRELTATQKALIKSALLFPKEPSTEQMESAQQFQKSANNSQHGWISQPVIVKKSL